MLTRVYGYTRFPKQNHEYLVIEILRKSSNHGYLKKCDFQNKLVCQIWDCHWICGIEMSPIVVLDPDFESHLASKQNEIKFLTLNSQYQKMWLYKRLQTKILCMLKIIFCHDHEFEIVTSK